MADDLPDAPWAAPASHDALPDAPWVAPKQSFGSHMAAAVTDIPHEIYEAGKSALTSINDHLNPFSDAANASVERRLQATKEGGFFGGMGEEVKSGLDVGRGLAAIPALAASPITGAGRSVIGHALAAPGQISYEQAKDQADTAMMALAPARGVKPIPIPPRPTPGPLGVTLSEGQASGALPAIQREQAALRGASGERAQAQAQEFADQQKAQLAGAREDIAKSLDAPPLPQNHAIINGVPHHLNPNGTLGAPIGSGQIIAESPQEAGQLVSDTVRQAAAQRKAGVKQAYDTAKSYPGEIHASAFDDIGNAIKSDLSARPEPIIIDDKLTPYASRAIDDVEKRIEQLSIQNRASPYGQPPRQSIVGVNLEGVDQMRRRLSALRRDAYGSGNATDGRATKAVLDAFDDHVDRAVNSGAFQGDPRAVQAWNNARAAHSDYKGTFSGSKNDPAGRVVEKIIGKDKSGPATADAVADHLYGASGLRQSDLNVAVSNRIKSILGDQSPEWSAVKQGLFSRLVESGQGVNDFGAGTTATRLNKFLNGRMAQTVYAPHEVALLRQYASLLRQLQVPQAGANWSNTGTILAPILQKIGGNIGTSVAAVIGGAIGHATGLPIVGEAVGATVGAGAAKVSKAIGDVKQARVLAKQMPLVAQQIKEWQQAVLRAQNSPSQRAGVAVATGNLSRTLASMGIDFRALQASGTGHAVEGGQEGGADSQQDVPRPPGQHQHGGRVDREPDFAHGGLVDTPEPDAGQVTEDSISADMARRAAAQRTRDAVVRRLPAVPRADGGRVNPDNIDPSPSEAQKEAGNYAKDHIRLHGLDIAIENAKGGERSGTDKDGKPWSVKMPAHYGYIKGTVGKDKDHVDCYIGHHLKAPRVFIIDQKDADSGKFDEHKAFIGFASKDQAIRTYHKAFSDGRAAERVGHVATMSVDEFKRWLENGDTTKPSQHRKRGGRINFADGGDVQDDLPDQFEAAAARIRSRYPTREASPEAMAASQGNVGFGDVLASKAQSLASLPQRATQAAGELQQTGDAYDPGPALETAGLMAGARFPTVASGELGAMGGRPKAPVAAPVKSSGRQEYRPLEGAAKERLEAARRKRSEGTTEQDFDRLEEEMRGGKKSEAETRADNRIDDIDAELRRTTGHEPIDLVLDTELQQGLSTQAKALLRERDMLTGNGGESRASGGRVISPTIIRKYDVPYLAGSSNDGKHVYIDRRVPKRISVKLASGNGRKWVDPAEFLAAHETAEHAAMLKGKPYLQAHTEDADDAERAAVKKHGLSWDHYEKVLDGLLSHIEHEHPKNPPPDLYLRPYPHDKRKLLARLEKENAA